MEVKIERIIIDNFKGISHLDISFDGLSANIYGANGTGKSTIQDAYCWLMYNKDSKGRADFDIKPKNVDGAIANHGAESSVIGHISFDGKTVVLKKIYREKWSQKRGNPEATFDGNTCEYYIGDLPVTKSRYEASISELCPEKAFRLLSDMTYFNEQLAWQERRNILLEMSDTSKADELLDTPKYIDLKNEMGDYGIDDFKKVLASKRKEVNAAKSKIPERIDECNRFITTLTAIDFDGLKAECTELDVKIEELKKQLSDINGNVATQILKNQIDALTNERKALEIKNDAYRKSQINHGSDAQKRSLNEVINIYTHSKADAEKRLAKAITELSHTQAEAEKMRERWRTVNSETLDKTGTVCPTCGREYPEEEKVKIRDEFEAQKRTRLSEIELMGKKLKERSEQLDKDIKKYSAQIEENDNAIRSKRAKLEELNDAVVEIRDMDGYAEMLKEINTEEAKLTKELNTLSDDESAVRSRITEELMQSKQRADYIASELAKKSNIQHFENRISELNDEAAAYTAQINDYDRLTYLAEQYITERAKIIEDGVNSLFKYTKFKLYDTQINGAIIDMCEATYNGISYGGTLNSGHCVLVSMDIINTISGYYNISVPLFFDNAEKYTGNVNVATQTIKMTVSAEDRELRIIKENNNELNSNQKTNVKHTAA